MTKANSLYALVFFILFFPIPIPAQEAAKNNSASQGTLLSSLTEQTRVAISAKNIPSALDSYEKLFQLSFKEDKSLLESVCLKMFEQCLDSPNSELKKKLITLLPNPLNIPLARLLFKAFQDSDPDLRVQATDILAKFKDPALYSDLSASLASMDLQTLESALILIAKIKETTFLPQVQKLLEHPDPVIQSQAILTASQLKPDEATLAILKKMISHPSDRVRSAVLEAFIPLEEETLDLPPLLKDSSVRVRRALLAWAEKHPGKTGDSLIRRELAEKDTPLFPETCRSALQSDALLRRIDWSKIKQSDSVELREMALQALIKNGDFFLEEQNAFDFLSDPFPKIRNRAACAILESLDPGVNSLIHSILDSQNNKAREGLITSLIHSQKNPLSSRDLENLLTSGHAHIQALSVPLLDRMEPSRQMGILKQLLSSNKFSVRVALFSFLSFQKKSEWYRACYSEGLNDPAVQVQIEVLSGIHLLGNEGLEQKILEEGKGSAFAAVRAVCVRSATVLSKEARKPWIAFGLQDKIASVRKAALELSLTLEDPAFILQTFSNALFDPEETVRNYVIEILQKSSALPDEGLKKTETSEPEKEAPELAVSQKTDTSMAPEKKPDSSTRSKNPLLSWLKASSSKGKKNVSLKEEPLASPIPKESLTVSQNVTGNLKQLLASKDNKVSALAEDYLLEMGDENEILKLKNRLTQSTKEEREKISEKLGLLADPSLAPLIRAQLRDETDEETKIHLGVALWKITQSLD